MYKIGDKVRIKGTHYTGTIIRVSTRLNMCNVRLDVNEDLCRYFHTNELYHMYGDVLSSEDYERLLNLNK